MRYYIAILADFPELLADKIAAFAGDRLVSHFRSLREEGMSGSAWELQSDSQDIRGRTLSGTWALAPKGTSLLPEVPYQWAFDTPLDELDESCARLVAAVPWVILPWGGFMTLESFAFLTATECSLTSFVAAGPRIRQLSMAHLDLVPIELDSLLSAYSIESSIVNHARMVVVDEVDPGARLWRTFCSNNESLLVATGDPEWMLDFGVKPDIDPDGDLGPDDLWETTPETLRKDGRIQNLGLVGAADPWNAGERWLYRVRDQNVFQLICSRSKSANGVPSAVLSGNVPEAAALRWFRNYFGALDDWQRCRGQLPAEIEWFYTAGDSHMDVVYQTFASSDPSLIRKFIKSSSAPHFETISFF
jgi:hypothetical protein